MRNWIVPPLLLAAALGLTESAHVASAEDATPVEFGAIPWMRRIEEAQAEAKKKDRPMLVLFQEVPG